MKRRFSKAEIDNYLNLYHESEDKNVRAFCRNYGIAPSNMYGWLKKVKDEQSQEQEEKCDNLDLTTSVAFAEVVDITKSNKIEPSNDITGVSITVNDIKVNIDENFNQKTLFDVLRIVKMI